MANLVIEASQLTNFSSWQNDSTTADLIIKFNNSEQCVLAHQLLLLNASSYFKGLLLGPLAKNRSVQDNKTVITLEDIEVELFKLILDYVYTGSIKLAIDNSWPLLQLAARLQLDQLSADLISQLAPNLDLVAILSILSSYQAYGQIVKRYLISWLIQRPGLLQQELIPEIIELLKEPIIKNILLEVLSSDDLPIKTEKKILPIIKHYAPHLDLMSIIRSNFVPTYFAMTLQSNIIPSVWFNMLKANSVTHLPRNSYKQKLQLTSWRLSRHPLTGQPIAPYRPSKYLKFQEQLSGTCRDLNRATAQYVCHVRNEGIKYLLTNSFGLITKPDSYFDESMSCVMGCVGPTGSDGVMGFVGPTGPVGLTDPYGTKVSGLTPIIVLVNNLLIQRDNQKKKPWLLIRDCHDQTMLAATQEDDQINQSLIGQIITITDYEQHDLVDEYDQLISTTLHLLTPISRLKK